MDDSDYKFPSSCYMHMKAATLLVQLESTPLQAFEEKYRFLNCTSLPSSEVPATLGPFYSVQHWSHYSSCECTCSAFKWIIEVGYKLVLKVAQAQ